MKRILLIFALMLSIIPSLSFGASDNVYVIEISGEVNPGMLNYVRENIEDANMLEKFYINKYDTFNNGYNSTIGGNGTTGNRSVTEKTIKYKESISVNIDLE